MKAIRFAGESDDEACNPKLKTPKKAQAANSNLEPVGLDVEVGAWVWVFGWGLDFGNSSFSVCAARRFSPEHHCHSHGRSRLRRHLGAWKSDSPDAES